MRVALAFIILLLPLLGADATTAPARSVRVAVIGPINENGFFAELSRRFEAESGIHVDVVASGNKDNIRTLFKQGVIDWITMQPGDAVLDLVADGWASDAVPWVQDDLIIVGPVEDPAKIRGLSNAGEALNKIIESKSALVIHGSADADRVARDLLDAEQLQLDEASTTIVLNDHQRQVLQLAAGKRAYTLIARVPFENGKLRTAGVVEMVRGDERLRRPFISAIADPTKAPSVHLAEARTLASFVRSSETQKWITEYRAMKQDDSLPMFFPIVQNAPTTKP